MEINRKTARVWSRMGCRAFYGQAFSKLAMQHDHILGMSADLGRSSGLATFASEYPDKFINCGIAEQNMVGVAAGLSRAGYNVFASTFAPFASMRASEQVRMNMGYMHEPVKLVALGSGLAMGFLGNSHFGLEDIAIMRTVPDLTIISPADCYEIYKTLESLIHYNHPTYIRLTGAINVPVVYDDDYEFNIGKAVLIKPIKKTTIIATGTTVGQAKLAVENLESEGIQLGLINMHTLKPLDEEILNEVLAECDNIIVCEEHTQIGGTASAILEFANNFEKVKAKIWVHCLKDIYHKTGDYQYMIQQSKLDTAGIQEKVHLVKGSR